MTEQNPKRRKLENSGFEYTVSVSNDTQQLNTIERNTNQLGHMIVALNARLDTYSTKTTEQTLKMDTILHKIAKLETNIDSLMIKNTQDAPRSVYRLVPIQDFSELWTDEQLYKKYDLNEKEIEFIESMVRPMELK